MASKVLLRMCPSWPLSKSRVIQHPPSTMLTGDALAGFPHYWLGLACLDLSVDHFILALKKDLSVDPKSQISSTCKSTQIHITSKNNTNSTRTIHTAIHFFTLELNTGRQSGQLTPDNSVQNNNLLSSIWPPAPSIALYPL
jgi:hypothetical protein